MLRGNFALDQELMRLYEQPVMANISYCKITKDPFPTPQEAQVWFNMGQEEQTAFVPLRIVNRTKADGHSSSDRRGAGENNCVLPSHKLWNHQVPRLRRRPREDSHKGRRHGRMKWYSRTFS